ncbi:hypothetical protein BC936DRAFT_148892 [Jimgerdemannia flammicorona]|uniref:Uncharacterized protein n=1 Tax=Jimgerdemannia flammicorona TaxID=994334 RepID=A0A433D235_9FUNG|nr:hypothetical protein BC936DRAFT_148892 [Jimgerdemannia flammicorona]
MGDWTVTQWKEMKNVVKTETYEVTGDVVYHGLGWGHPRFSIPIAKKDEDKTGAIGQVVIHNEKGHYVTAFGILHWAWDGDALWVFPVYSEADYNPLILAKYQQVIYKGVKITVTFTPMWGIVPGDFLH